MGLTGDRNRNLAHPKRRIIPLDHQALHSFKLYQQIHFPLNYFVFDQKYSKIRNLIFFTQVFLIFQNEGNMICFSVVPGKLMFLFLYFRKNVSYLFTHHIHINL